MVTDFEIRAITADDESAVLALMREFYSSPAVFTNGSEKIFLADIKACLSDSPYIEGYVFTAEKTVKGYAMLAKSFSTEFGKPCIWVEDLYISPECRNSGLGSAFFRLIEEKYPDSIFRLEVEEENEGAVRLYRRNGFTVLPYTEMKK